MKVNSYLQDGNVIIVSVIGNQNRTSGYQIHELLVRVVRNGDELALAAS